MNVLARYKQIIALKCLTEGMSINATARIVGCKPDTVAKLGVDTGKACWMHEWQVLRGLTPAHIEADELWAFIYAKEAHLERCRAAPDEAGSSWTWVAIDRESKLVLAWLVGDRTAKSGEAFMRLLDKRIDWLHIPHLSTDGHTAYEYAVKRGFRGRLDYGQVVKEYGGYGHRYIGSHKTTIKGAPKDAEVSTSIVERVNLTIRMSSRRYTRQSNGFSKRQYQHKMATALMFFHYNFMRPHESLGGRTPAQVAGVAKRRWTYDDLADLLAASAPRARLRGNRKRRRRWQVRPRDPQIQA